MLCDSDIILADDVSSYLGRAGKTATEKVDEARHLSVRLREFRRTCIIEALNETKGNISAAANILGMDRSNLRRAIKELNINIE